MRIDKLAPSTKVKGRWLCHLEDGSILRVGENELADFGLYSGMELSGETIAALTAAAGKGALREKALKLVAARPLSRKELLAKLTDEGDGECAETAGEIVDWLEELGYINDAEYAAAIARHYAAKGYGERKIQDELWRRGVPRELWQEAGEAAPPPDSGIDAFLRQKLRGKVPDEKELRRLTAALARRGHRWGDIKDGLRRYGAEIEEE